MVSRNAVFETVPDAVEEGLPNRLLGEAWAEDESDSPVAQAATNGMPIAFIRHLGANGLSARTEGVEEGFDRDVVAAPVSNAFTEVVAGYLKIPEGMTEAVVRLYGPPPAATDPADARRPMAWEWRRSGDGLSGTVVPFAISNRAERMTVGMRVLRACAFDDSSVTNYSAPVQIRLTPGTTVVPQTLLLEQSTP